MAPAARLDASKRSGQRLGGAAGTHKPGPYGGRKPLPPFR